MTEVDASKGPTIKRQVLGVEGEQLECSDPEHRNTSREVGKYRDNSPTCSTLTIQIPNIIAEGDSAAAEGTHPQIFLPPQIPGSVGSGEESDDGSPMLTPTSPHCDYDNSTSISTAIVSDPVRLTNEMSPYLPQSVLQAGNLQIVRWGKDDQVRIHNVVAGDGATQVFGNHEAVDTLGPLYTVINVTNHSERQAGSKANGLAVGGATLRLPHHPYDAGGRPCLSDRVQWFAAHP